MKNKKKLTGLIVGLVCVLVCVALVLTMCWGGGDDSGAGETTGDTAPETTQATQTDESTAAATTEATEAATETTAATEVTVATQATQSASNAGTEATEDPLAEEADTQIPEPGTAGNPYVEAVSKLPGSFTTVKVDGKGSICYSVYDAAGTILTVEDKNAYVIYRGITYEAEDGKVTVNLPADLEGPAALTVGNKAPQKAAYALQFTAQPGQQSNPIQAQLQQLPKAITTPTVAAGNSVYYTVSGAKDTVLKISDNVKVVYNGVTYEAENGVVSVALTEDTAALQIVNGGKEAKCFTLSFSQRSGGAACPYAVKLSAVPGSYTALFALRAGGEDYYTFTGVSGTQLTIENENIYVVYNDQVYEADEQGRIIIDLDSDAEEITLCIGSTAEEDVKVTFRFAKP